MISETVMQQLKIDFVVALNHLPCFFFLAQRTQISNQIYLASEVQLQIDTTITMQRQTHPIVCKQDFWKSIWGVTKGYNQSPHSLA